ncbi:MAG TPA: peptidoglycan-binding protein, partial [Bauldia sp.]|nr:peptidoglycan-binding protein [Bauldia sp.]
AEKASAAAVASALDEFRAAVDRLAAARTNIDPAAVATLATGLAELRLRVDGLEKAGRSDTEILRRLENRVEDIARRDSSGVVRGLEERIEALATRLEAALRAPQAMAAIDAVRGEVAAIRAELAVRAPQDTQALERQIGELADRVAAASRDDADSRQLAAIEARVEELAAELARTTPRAAALEQVEENLVRLQVSLVEGRRESIEAARAAARNAVREFAASGGDRDLVESLRRDLEEIRRLVNTGERPAGSGEDPLKATVAGVADKIDAIGEPVPPAATPPPAAPPSPARPYILAAREPPIPRAVRPDLAAVRELARNASGAGDKPAGRRADFIAAARRAAQAAVAEADAGTGIGVGDRTVVRPDAGDSAFARIGQAIRARRRSLLLAAAAVVLAIGALQLVGRPPVEMAEVVPVESPPPAIIVHRPPAAPAPAAAPGSTRAAVPRLDETALVPPGTDATSAMALAAQDTMVTGSTTTAPSTAGGLDPIRLAAERGDPAAAYELGTRYAEGKGVARDLAQAAAWYQRAADAGLAPAQYRLGSLYERGQGVAKDMAKAVALYRSAADRGNVGAMHNLAVLTSEGAAGTPDPKGAISWFLKAANYGVRDSQYNLGVVYARGLGTRENLPESYKWFAIAALSGDKDAAARRDEVAALLDQDQLAIARAAVKAWRPKSPPAIANTVTLPSDAGSQAADGLTAEDQSALVRTIQTLLAEQGYDPGPADGVEGPKTREAVRAFQASAGLESNGRIDRSLVAALAGGAG